MRSSHYPASAHGASLIETLVATVLGLVVLVLSTKSLLATLDFARNEAVQRRSPVAICGLDPRDARASSGQVHCARAGAAWNAGWIVYGDANLNGELDDGEVVLQ